MTTPSRMVIWGANDRTTGVVGSGTAGAMKGGVGARGRASRVETASLFAVDRSPRGKGWLVVREAWWSRAGGAGRAMRPTRAWLVALKRWRLARWVQNSFRAPSPAHLTPGSQHPDRSDNYDPCYSTVATLTRIPTIAPGPVQAIVFTSRMNPNKETTHAIFSTSRNFPWALKARRSGPWESALSQITTQARMRPI
jgi:hypothetical protein